MPHVVEDYYDMPIELLPSANFAGRPTSDIDMLAGLWVTAAYSNFSSEDEADDDDKDKDNRASPQQQDASRLSRNPPRLPVRMPPGEEPSRTITFPPTDDISVTSGVRVLARTRSRKKTQSAPYGSLDARASPPFETGRAGGAKLGYFDTMKRTKEMKKRIKSCDLVMTKCSGGQSNSRVVLATPQGSGASISPWTGAKQFRTSLAQQTRVRSKRQSEQLAPLKTDCAEDESSPSAAASPSSMVSTPRELYAIGEAGTASETLGSPQMCCARRLTPANIRVPVGEMMCSPSSRSNTQCRSRHRHRQTGRRIIYLPGAIMLARKPTRLRRDSVATAGDASTFDDSRLGSEQKDYAEQVGLEEDITTFFADFGVVAEATEATLDRYWLGSRKCSVQVPVDSDTVESVSKAGEAQAEAGHGGSGGGRGTGRGSRLSLSSASSCLAAVSRPERRKRSRLRDLLLSPPGLPGAVFVKAPAS
jgi:hypothetical protein